MLIGPEYQSAFYGGVVIERKSRLNNLATHPSHSAEHTPRRQPAEEEPVKIDLKDASQNIGTLIFSTDARQLQAARTAGGMIVWFPAEATFPFLAKGSPNPYLTDVRLIVFQGGIEIGIGADPGFHWGQGSRPFAVGVRLTAPVLAAVERVRNGGRVAFRLHVDAKCGLVVDDGGSGIVNRPTIVTADVDIELDRDRWVDILHSTGWGENIVCEVALPPRPEPPWDEVWKAVRSARDALDRGGPSGWKACITEARTALEKWRTIEPLDTGANVGSSQLTRQQRFDVLRQSVHRFTHDAVHSDAERSTRAEAVMILGAVAGLLGARVGQ